MKKRSSGGGGKPSPMQAIMQILDLLQPYLVSGFRKLIEGDLRSIQKLNAIVSIFLGVCCIFLPHRFISKSNDYNHFAHEMIRLYGCVSFGIGYLVYWTRTIKDSRLMRATTETFCICYGLQALCILRAQFASPQGELCFFVLQNIPVVFTSLVSLNSYSYSCIRNTLTMILTYP